MCIRDSSTTKGKELYGDFIKIHDLTIILGEFKMSLGFKSKIRQTHGTSLTYFFLRHI